jgi:hypothetical protein
VDCQTPQTIIEYLNGSARCRLSVRPQRRSE